MTLIETELLAATAIAFSFGLILRTRRAWFLASVGIALAAWLLRCGLIVERSGADTSVAEEFLDTMTFWNVTGEVAGMALWFAVCCGLGKVLATLRKAVKVRFPPRLCGNALM